MPYAYGMQNSPVVGNGLGGLPRRTTAVAAASTQRTITPVNSYNSSSTASGYSSAGRMLNPICFSNRIIQLYRYTNSSAVTQYMSSVIELNADGSAASNTATQVTDTTIQSHINSLCSWNDHVEWHVINSTQVVGICLWKVCVLNLNANGTIASTVYITLPSSGSYANGGTFLGITNQFGGNTSTGTCRSSFVTPDGTIIVGATDNNNQIGLFVFNLAGTFIKALSLSLFAYALSNAAIFKAKFGYTVAFSDATADGAGSYYTRLYAFTVDNSISTIISQSGSYKWITDASANQNASPVVRTLTYDYANNIVFWHLNSGGSAFVIDAFTDAGVKLDTTSTTINCNYDAVAPVLTRGTYYSNNIQFGADSLNCFTRTTTPLLTHSNPKISGSDNNRYFALVYDYPKVLRQSTELYSGELSLNPIAMIYIGNVSATSVGQPRYICSYSSDLSVIATSLNTPSSLGNFTTYWSKNTVS